VSTTFSPATVCPRCGSHHVRWPFNRPGQPPVILVCGTCNHQWTVNLKEVKQ